MTLMEIVLSFFSDFFFLIETKDRTISGFIVLILKGKAEYVTNV